MSVFGPFIALTDNFHFDNTPLNPVAFVQKYLRQNIQNFLFPEVKKNMTGFLLVEVSAGNLA